MKTTNSMQLSARLRNAISEGALDDLMGKVIWIAVDLSVLVVGTFLMMMAIGSNWVPFIEDAPLSLVVLLPIVIVMSLLVASLVYQAVRLAAEVQMHAVASAMDAQRDIEAEEERLVLKYKKAKRKKKKKKKKKKRKEEQSR